VGSLAYDIARNIVITSGRSITCVTWYCEKIPSFYNWECWFEIFLLV